MASFGRPSFCLPHSFSKAARMIFFKTQICSCHFLFKILPWLLTPLRIATDSLVPTYILASSPVQGSRHTQLLSVPQTPSSFLPQGISSHYFCCLNSPLCLPSDLYLANSCSILQIFVKVTHRWPYLISQSCTSPSYYTATLFFLLELS